MESDWVLEYVINLINSPAWEVPVMAFIEENCIVFDSDDENKFAYTDIHKQFKDMVEAILESHLADIGVDTQSFARVCDQDSERSCAITEAVMTQILAMDDFMTFKKLMVKRNMELEYEAVKALQESFVSDDKGLSDDEGGAFDKASESDEDKFQTNTQLLEMELLHQQIEMEQADLETAIAMSLALEDAQVREQSEKLEVSSSDSKIDPRQALKQSRKALEDDRSRHREYRQKAEVSQEELNERSRHLRQQRDKIVAQRKKDREKKLREFNEVKCESKESTKIHSDAKDIELPKSESKVSDADERRQALRIALARRMKQDLLEAESDMSHHQMHQYSQYTGLDEKLRQVEMIRKENRRHEEETVGYAR